MVSADVKQWIEYMDAKNLDELIGKRPVYVWGAYSKGVLISQALENRNLVVKGYIDAHNPRENYCGKPVCTPDKILHDRACYVVIAIEGIRDEIIDYLKQYDCRPDIDYLYFSQVTPEIEICGLRGNYKDVYNNSFCYNGNEKINIHVICKGYNNSLYIADGFMCVEGQIKVILGYGSTVELGRYFHSTGEVVINADRGGKIQIGTNFVAMDSASISAQDGGKIEIGNYVSTCKRFLILSGRMAPVSIGTDCLISADVSILGTSGHSILDLEGKRAITPANEGPVIVGNHVWLGKSSGILSNTKIGDGSILGACSLAKGQYPENSIIAGNIAKVIRSNCTWDKRQGITFEEF